MPKSISYTTRVDGLFYFRITVPAPLRPLVGRRELKRSLQTRDPKIAALSAPLIASQVFTCLDKLRTVAVGGSDADKAAALGQLKAALAVPYRHPAHGPSKGVRLNIFWLI